jgi:hypothetical protein
MEGGELPLLRFGVVWNQRRDRSHYRRRKNAVSSERRES